jgi:exopolyphosphatase/guanosine-5'-triphosphate,3'-diphosphate pyrophosphatase
MGQGVHATKKLHADALLRMDECLKKYSEILKVERPDRVIAMATSAARDVTNASELFDIGRKYNIPIEIIPGEREAQITFDGAVFDRAEKNHLGVVDVGGGSTEVIGMNERGQVIGASVNVGSVRLTEMFVTQYPTPRSEVEKILKYAEAKFSEVRDQLPVSSIRELIAVAGTPTTLAAVLQNQIFNEEAVNGFVIRRETLEQWLYKLAELNLEERMHLTGMDPKRADVIVAGTAILLTALRFLSADKMTVSTRGVRDGVALYGAQQ